MVMCASDCNCKWYKLSDMAYHPIFKERVDALIAEYEKTIPPKPRAKTPPDDIF